MQHYDYFSVAKTYTGVNLQVNESVFVIEGGMQEICIVVNDYGQMRQRGIPISLSIVSHSVTIGMFTTSVYLPHF